MKGLHTLATVLLVHACGIPAHVHAQAPSSAARPNSEHAALSPPKLIVCGVAPVNSACNIALRAGQDSVQFSVEINPIVQHPDKDSVPVTISASRCCVRSQLVLPDRNGYVSLTWAAAQKPDSNVYVYFMMRDSVNRVLRDSVQIAKALPADAPLAVATSPYRGAVPRYVWVRGDHIPVTIPIAINAIGTEKDDTTRQRVLRERCETVRAVFVALQGGDASPDSARAMWYPRREGMAWHPTDGNCRVETRWKLADDAGEQQLDVVIGGDSGIARNRFSVTAFARQTPRLVGGYGYFAGLRQDRDLTCAEAREHSRCTGKADSAAVTIQVREPGASAYFALEYPIFLRYQISDGAGVGKYLSEHLRLVFGSTFERPADNIFVGVTLMPLVSGASEASPFQLSAGVGRHGLRTWYVGMSLDASTIVGPILSAIGIGK